MSPKRVTLSRRTAIEVVGLVVAGVVVAGAAARRVAQDAGLGQVQRRAGPQLVPQPAKHSNGAPL